MKIGVMVESFRKGFREGVEEAARLGAQGIQAYMTPYGYMTAEEMTAEKIREVMDIVSSNGLVFSAICGDFGVGFADEEQNKIYVDKSKRVLEKAKDVRKNGNQSDVELKMSKEQIFEKAKELGCDIVTTHIGRIPEEECAVKETMRKACRSLAEFADSMGSSFAVETGTESGRILCDFLDSLGAGGVRVNFDPANLVMVAGDRPERAVADVGKYIVHTHAKDGYKLDESLPEDVKIVIGGEAKDHEALLGMGRAYIEVPLGEGGVNFDTYLPALAATGFDGFLTVEREVGEDPCRDIGLAVRFLREKLEKMGL